MAGRMVQWLIDEQIIVPGRRDGILGDALGWPPGPLYHKATGRPSSWLLGCTVNGLEVEAKRRRVFYSMGNPRVLVCRACGSRSEGGDAPGEAIGQWYHGTGAGLLKCPSCGHSDPITEWTFDPPWGFASLGFTFWNWPQLEESFVREFSRRLGHQIVLVYGKV